MFANYLKIAFRNIRKQKGYSFINIFGLASGMACCLLILLWVQDELSFDKFHKNSENIYRVVQEADHAGQKVRLSRTPPLLGPVLKNEFPEIDKAARCWMADITFQFNNRLYANEGIITDTDFLKMFTYPLLKGEIESALSDPSSIVITSEMAIKIFGNSDVIGEVIKSAGGNDYQITAIVENPSQNSHQKFDFLLPFSIFNEFGSHMWAISNNPMYTYILLKGDSSPEIVDKKIGDIITKNAPETITRVYLQPLESIYLYSDFAGDLGGHGDIKYVYIFFMVALFIITIACINFMNLSTARSGGRSKEVGIRKVVGAEKSQLIRQFFGESLFLSILALLFACIFVLLFLPTFNNLSGKQLNFNFSDMTLILGFIGITLFTGIVSGSYPALFLSSFRPVQALKGRAVSGTKSKVLRKILVLIQFTLSIILITSTFVVYNQLSFMRNMKLGFDKECLLYLPMNDAIRENFQPIKDELLNNSTIDNVTYSSHILTDVTHVHGNLEWEGKDPAREVPMNCLMVDEDFVKTMEMEIVDGRDFLKELKSDEGETYIVNETAAAIMGFSSPVGKEITYQKKKGRIIGVVKDFHFKPLHKELEPMILINSSDERFYMYIRISGDISASIQSIKTVWNRFFPDVSFEYKFLDKSLDNMYISEMRVGKIFNYFTALAIIISCLGLFGLASFTAEQRTKEIGIRKVLGASVTTIVLLLGREFVKWVVIANLFAGPIAYFVMKNWLANFAYRTNFSIWTFIYSGMLAFIIALVTVSYQSVKAAVTNPVESLMYE